MLLSAIRDYQNKGVTLDDALKALPGLFEEYSANPFFKQYIKGTNLEEVTAFVKDNW